MGGVRSRDDIHLFEMLVLEGAQAGLSWSTSLNKRASYRQAFDSFDPLQGALRRRQPRFASGGSRHRPQSPESPGPPS